MPVLYLVCAWREWEGSRTRMLCHEKLALYREGRGGGMGRERECRARKAGALKL